MLVDYYNGRGGAEQSAGFPQNPYAARLGSLRQPHVQTDPSDSLVLRAFKVCGG